MFYKRNLPFWERVARFVGATLLGLCALRFGATPAGLAFGIFGVMAAVTALIGFCPMCAIAGRRLRARSE
jgi:hypothetical protein